MRAFREPGLTRGLAFGLVLGLLLWGLILEGGLWVYQHLLY